MTILDDMKNGIQFADITYADHGQMVVDRFNDLIGERKLEWRLPDNFEEFQLNQFYKFEEQIKEYQFWHDCGKPYCLIYDNDGRKHYPNHAEVSKKTYLSFSDNQFIAELIGRDMDMHIIKPAELEIYDRKDLIPILLITALCEVHANASMFGGIESTSFKIKWKSLNKLFKHYLLAYNK